MAAAAAARAMVLCVVLCCWLLGLPARRRPAALRRNQLRRTRWAPHAGESSAQARDDSGVVGGKTRKRAWSSPRRASCLSSEALGHPRKASYETVPYGFDKKLSSAHKQRAAQAPSSRRTPRERSRHAISTTGRARHRSRRTTRAPRAADPPPWPHTKQNGQRHVHEGRKTIVYCGHGQRHTNRKEGDGHDPQKFRDACVTGAYMINRDQLADAMTAANIMPQDVEILERMFTMFDKMGAAAIDYREFSLVWHHSSEAT